MAKKKVSCACCFATIKKAVKFGQCKNCLNAIGLDSAKGLKDVISNMFSNQKQRTRSDSSSAEKYHLEKEEKRAKKKVSCDVFKPKANLL